MITEASLETTARELLEQQWRRASEQFSELAGSGGPPTWVLPQLLELVRQMHDRPVQQWAPMIRSMLGERLFHDGCGDHMTGRGRDREAEACLDRQVCVLVLVLERIRQEAIRTGQWSSLPTTPEMFG